MKYILIIFLTCQFNFGIAQNTTLKNIENLINSNCLGEPTSRKIYKETVKFKAVDENNIEIIVENIELNTGNLTRKNKFNFKITDLDADNIIVKKSGDFFGIYLYTKNFKKSIKQSTLLVDEARTSILYQEVIHIAEFKDENTVMEIKSNFIKAIENSKKQKNVGHK